MGGIDVYSLFAITAGLLFAALSIPVRRYALRLERGTALLRQQDRARPSPVRAARARFIKKK